MKTLHSKLMNFSNNFDKGATLLNPAEELVKILVPHTN